jgi:hypothetical protein
LLVFQDSLFIRHRNNAMLKNKRENVMSKVIIIREADMQSAPLYAAMTAVTPQRLGKVSKAISAIVAERTAYEANRERMIDGALTVGQSPDIKHLQALDGHDAFARMVIALNIDARSFLFPQSQESGKSSAETSNLKALRKVRQIADVIASGVSDLENVARVFTVCAYRFASKGNEVLTREYCENFLTSRELAELDTGTAELWSAVEDVRAKHMSTGAQTQSGQMVRTLVALKSAEDVRDGRAKNVRIHADGLVMQALMTRFGQVAA